MAGMLKNSGDPMAALENLAAKNPAAAELMNKAKAQDPKQLFYSECARKGINPEDILGLIK